MNHAMQIRVSEHPAGRVVLHLLALRRDGLWRWHGRAIRREFMRRSKPAGQARLRSVTLVLEAPEARDVWFSGEFNGWSSNALPLLRQANGVWSITIALPPGRYQYKFVADGQWLHDPTARENVPDGYGSFNSVLEIRA